MYPSASGSNVLFSTRSPTLCNSDPSSSYRYGHDDSRSEWTRTDLSFPDFRDSNLDVVLLLPPCRYFPAIDHDGIAAVPVNQSVMDVQSGAAGAHEFPSPGGENQASARTQ